MDKELKSIINNFQEEPLKSLPHYLSVVINCYLKMINALTNSYNDPKNRDDYMIKYVEGLGKLFTIKRIEEISGENKLLMCEIQKLLDKDSLLVSLEITTHKDNSKIKTIYPKLIKGFSELYLSYVNLLLEELNSKGWLKNIVDEQQVNKYSTLISLENSYPDFQLEIKTMLTNLLDKFILKKYLS